MNKVNNYKEGKPFFIINLKETKLPLKKGYIIFKDDKFFFNENSFNESNFNEKFIKETALEIGLKKDIIGFDKNMKLLNIESNKVYECYYGKKKISNIISILLITLTIFYLLFILFIPFDTLIFLIATGIWLIFLFYLIDFSKKKFVKEILTMINQSIFN